MNDNDEMPVSGDDSPVGFFKVPPEIQKKIDSDRAEAERVQQMAIQQHCDMLLSNMVQNPLFVNSVRVAVARYMEDEAARNIYLERLIDKLGNIAESMRVRVRVKDVCLDRDRMKQYFKKSS